MKREELLKVAKPILFNTEMVQAIMAGRKTVTRRVIKPQPEKTLWYIIAGYGHGKWHEEDNIKGRLWTPPYHADDILYVRETWMNYAGMNIYKASCDEYQIEALSFAKFNWKPSIHMPKDAARIFLKVKTVRVERLQEITEEQACKEGVGSFYVGMGEHGYSTNSNSDSFYDSPIGAFASLWDTTIKKQDVHKYGWDANPYVWVIEFERIEVE